MKGPENSRIQAILYNVLVSIQRATDLIDKDDYELIQRLSSAFVQITESKNMLGNKEW